MPIRIFNPLERPSASDFNRYFMQQHSRVKSSDESVISSTTLQDDNHLFAPVDANTDYWVWCLIFYTGAAEPVDGDCKLNWDAPSGATFDWLSDSLGSATTGPVNIVSRNKQDIGSSPSAGTTGGNTAAPIKGLLRVGGTAGTLQLTWAQLASTATPTTIYAGSTLLVRRLTS